MTSTTLITVAPTGAESAKADVPALPVTVEEIAATARDCQAVGASVIHLHIRDAETRPTLDLVYVREVVAAVRETTDLVVQLSSGGAVTDPFDARLAVLEAQPDAASLTLGTVVRHHELGVVALALVKQSVAVDAALTVAGSTASIDPDDAPADTDAERAAARERIRAVRSATIGR